MRRGDELADLEGRTVSAGAATARKLPAFSILLVAMLLELVVGLFVGTTARGLGATRLVASSVMLAALFVVGLGRRGLLILFAMALAGQLALLRWHDPSLVAAATMLRLTFLCWVLTVILWRVLHDRSVSPDTIAGTACAYTLLGFVWANLYGLLEQWRPGSLAIPESFLPPDRDPQAALAYFSFVTLTTVGYGVIHPTNPAVGGVCVIEALVGQLYLAIMIARMVGLHTAGRAR